MHVVVVVYLKVIDTLLPGEFLISDETRDLGTTQGSNWRILGGPPGQGSRQLRLSLQEPEACSEQSVNRSQTKPGTGRSD